MKAMVLREFNEPLILEEVEIPSVGRGELLIKVKACGVCASNVKYSKGTDPCIKLPHILGHEPVGEVAEVGPDVKDFSPGDRVSVYIFITCGKCLYCRRGDENNCTNCDRIGMELPGAYAEYVKVPATNAFKIPDGVPYDEACVIADAINTPFHAIRGRAKLRIGEEVVIVGIGGLGIHAVQIAKASGARVIAIDIVQAKLAFAKQYGADEIINARNEGISAKVRSLTNGNGVDVYVDFVGTPDSLGEGLRSLKRAGRLVIVGNDPLKRDLQFNPHKAVTFEEIEIMGSHAATRQEMLELLQLVKAGTIKPVIAARYPLNQVNEAHRALEHQETPGRIILVI